MEDKQVTIFIDGEEVDYTTFTDELNDMEYMYKKNGKWYIHKCKPKIIDINKMIENIERKIREYRECIEKDW